MSLHDMKDWNKRAKESYQHVWSVFFNWSAAIIKANEAHQYEITQHCQ